MNHFLYQLLSLVAFLAHTARSSAPPVQRFQPSNSEKRPCYSRFRGMTTWSLGTCQEPNDSYQCEDGITAYTGDCGRREGGSQIKCCIHLSCNSRYSGTCQNNFKNCNGEWTVSWVFFFFSFLHFASRYQSFEVRTFPLYPSGLSMMRMRINKRKRKADGERTRGIIVIQLLASLEIIMFRYIILVLNRTLLHAVLQRIGWVPGDLVRVPWHQIPPSSALVFVQ